MNTVKFFGHDVSRLIVGDNPVTGHSYIEDVTSGAEMKHYYTIEKILELLFGMEKNGINTFLVLADPFMIRILDEYERSGGRLKYIFQPYMAMNQNVSMSQMMALKNTIAIYHQGTTTDQYYETGRLALVHEQIEKYHSMGIPVGLGTHRPDVIERSEREGWNVDFYMACLQNARKGREGEASGFLTGKTKAHLKFYPEDRPVMLECLKKVEKPIIAFKIFAGGQMFCGKKEEEKRQIIKDVYSEVFGALKPNDMAAMGVFRRDRDELAENVLLYNEWYRENGGAE